MLVYCAGMPLTLGSQLGVFTITGRSPFLSPDGRWVGYFASNQIRKVAIAEGAARHAVLH